jgi:hypothetical protein
MAKRKAEAEAKQREVEAQEREAENSFERVARKCCRSPSHSQRFRVTAGRESSPLGMKSSTGLALTEFSEYVCAPELLVQYPDLQARASFGLCPSRRDLYLRVERILRSQRNQSAQQTQHQNNRLERNENHHSNLRGTESRLRLTSILLLKTCRKRNTRRTLLGHLPA